MSILKNFSIILMGFAATVCQAEIAIEATRVSTPSDLHQIDLQPHGSNTTVLQNSDKVCPLPHAFRGGTHTTPH